MWERLMNVCMIMLYEPGRQHKCVKYKWLSTLAFPSMKHQPKKIYIMWIVNKYICEIYAVELITSVYVYVRRDVSIVFLMSFIFTVA